jgi:hypothetical protein
MTFYKSTISQGYGDSCIVKNELVTEKEFSYRFNNKLDKRNFKLVDIKKNNTYWFFGARFECLEFKS